MNRSESIAALAAALSKAQAEIGGAIKDKTNPHFRTKYADLGAVVEAIRAPITRHGLSYVQILHDAANAARVETVILHASGEWLSCGPLSVPVSKADAQGYGSALTYARRYSLAAAFGVAPEDDDGNAAAKAVPEAPPEAPPKTGEPDTRVEEYVTWLLEAPALDALVPRYREALDYAKSIQSTLARAAFVKAKDQRKAELDGRAAA